MNVHPGSSAQTDGRAVGLADGKKAWDGAFETLGRVDGKVEGVGVA